MANPQYKNSDSKKNDQYLKILICTAGPTNKEDEIAQNKENASFINTITDGMLTQAKSTAEAEDSLFGRNKL